MDATAARPEAVTGPRRPDRGRDRVVRHLGADDRSSTRVRLVDGALRCLARQGIAKTTVDDIARAAGLSRATAYRTFPRGKDGILGRRGRDGGGPALLLPGRRHGRSRRSRGRAGRRHGRVGPLAAWHEPLTYLLEHEPGAVLPYVTFGGFDQVMLVASDLAAPFFARWLEPEQASRAAEWAVRIVMAYCSDPSPHADLTDPADTRALVRTFVLPGILALRLERGRTTDLRTHPNLNPSSTTTNRAPSSTRPTTKGAAQ